MTKKIIFQPGPAHLFRTTGIGYLKKISSHEIFLLIDESYNSSDLEEIKKICKKLHMYIYDSKNSFLNHRKINTIIKQIVFENNIKLFLIHNQIFVDNLYVIHYWKKNKDNAKLYTFQTGRQTLNFLNDRRDVLAFQALNNFNNLPFLNKVVPYKIKLIITRIRNSLSSCINFTIFPFLVIGTCFRPVINNLTGHIDEKRALNHKNNRHFMYLEVEKKALSKVGIKKIKMITNPVVSYVGCNNVHIDNIYNILIMPSYGYIENLISKNKENFLTVSSILDKWLNIIEVCKESIGSNAKINFIYKSHPAYENDPILDGIGKNFIESKNIKLIIKDRSSGVIDLISISNIVISDGSTVLWLAGILKKNAACVDLFGYDNIDEFKAYEPLVKYIDTFESLRITINKLTGNL